MKALAAVVIACTAAVVLTVALLVLDTPGVWWRTPLSLAALTATVGILALILVPRRWWRG